MDRWLSSAVASVVSLTSFSGLRAVVGPRTSWDSAETFYVALSMFVFAVAFVLLLWLGLDTLRKGVRRFRAHRAEEVTVVVKRRSYPGAVQVADLSAPRRTK